MNPMPSRVLRIAAASLLCLSLSSCGDDPELVRKREEQKAEIRRLDGELKVLQEKISQIPQDKTSELSKLKQNSEIQKDEIEGLEGDIASLQAKKAEIEKAHEAYKRKYVIR
jgi:septal ring factor EnvC (AmiA/AmiB activator)